MTTEAELERYTATCACGNKLSIQFERGVVMLKAKYLVRYRLNRTPFSYPPVCPTCQKAMEEQWEYRSKGDAKK